MSAERHHARLGVTPFSRRRAGAGADGHCEMGNRSLLNLRALDWLDERFEVGG
ncbi:hypothetical protein [Azospirillum argentinense]